MKLNTKGRGIAPSSGVRNLSEKVSCDMGYRSDSIAVLRDMGPLRLWEAVWAQIPSARTDGKLEC